MQQVSYGPLIMSIMLIMSCYTEFFNVRRGWQSLNTGPRFYLCLIWRTGWWWIYISRTTDGCPFKQKKLSVPFLYHRVPTELTPFRGLGRRNLVPILPPAHPLGEGGGKKKEKVLLDIWLVQKKSQIKIRCITSEYWVMLCLVSHDFFSIFRMQE